MQYERPGFGHGPRDKHPTTGPAPIPPVKLRSATYEKAPQRPSSASSDRPSSQRRVVRITRRKATRRSDEKRSFGPNSAKRKKNRSYRIAPDRAHTDSAKRTNGIPTRRPDRSETHSAKSVLITSFALFGNMLSKNRSHYLQNIPYTSRNDYEVTISKKTGITSSFAE